MRKYARASTPDFFNKYDPYTLLKSHFTLNFNVLSDFKIYYQNCNYLCQEGTQYEFNILNDKSACEHVVQRKFETRSECSEEKRINHERLKSINHA